MRTSIAITISAAAFIAFPISAKSPPKQRPLQKISLSFSDDTFGRTTLPKGARLAKKQSNPECSLKKLNDCEVIGANGLELYFSPYDGLNSKAVTVNESNKGAVSALSIGTARSKKDVLAAAIKFAPGLSFTCSNEETIGGPKAKDLNCRASVPETWNPKNIGQDPPTVILVFGEDNVLKSAMIMRSSYID